MKEILRYLINKFYHLKYNPFYFRNKGMAIAWNGKKTYFKKERLDFMKEAKELGDKNWFKFLSSHINSSRSWEYFLAAKLIDYSFEDVVLDVGAYNTYFCNYLAKKVKKIYAIDNFYWSKRDYVIKKHSVPTPDEWITRVKSSGDKNLVIEKGDLSQLAYPDNYFNKVVAISVIEHVIDDLTGFKEIKRVLKKNGSLVLTTEMSFNYHPYIEKTNKGEERFYRIYSYQRLIKLLKEMDFELLGPDYLLETLKSRYPKVPVIIFLINKK
ncbi:class I SAM-dependent methyltransferase [Patescibacteria group bacterium]|nr:class I SAM-dependent methyltransferase [Patescibacteria group bacterium]